MSNLGFFNWLPTTVKEARHLGWETVDVVLFSGDAYIDHPAFGVAVVARLLESFGLRVAVVPQPNWQDDLRDFKKFGKPNLFFGVTGGNLDSMLNHYTATKRLRSDDAFTPGNIHGKRPDYATVVYSNILKKIYPDVPVIIGGIEASMRRLSHYDYWSDSVKKSILIDTNADMLLYGMAEKSLEILVRKLQAGDSFNALQSIPQTAVLVNNTACISTEKCVKLPEYKHVCDKKKFAELFVLAEKNILKHYTKQMVLLQKYSEHQWLKINPSNPPLTQQELDAVYALPFTRLPHPKYKKKHPIPAYDMIKNSVTIHRGCFGGCSFCAIAMHQGKQIISRSEASIIKEIEGVSHKSDFSGVITDLGAPSANMYQMQGKDLSVCEKCERPSCLFPSICKNLDTQHKPLIDLYKKVKAMPKIKHVFIGSGIRYDLSMQKNNKDNGIEYLAQVIRNHTSGWFKVAPEHAALNTLKLMRKPSFDLYRSLTQFFNKQNLSAGKKQIIIPYLIAAHPGCKINDMQFLKSELIKLNQNPKQIQVFTPTPMTFSTAMYFSGINPYSKEPVYVPSTVQEKNKQKDALLSNTRKPQYKHKQKRRR